MKMEMEEDILESNLDPRLQIFMNKFNDFQEKLDEYEKLKVEATKEKDMWYEKSVQLEKQLHEIQNGDLSQLKKLKKKPTRAG